MTCLEITLSIALAYIIIGFVCYYYSESYVMAFASNKDEKLAAIGDILLWPMELIRIIDDSIENEYYE